MSRFILLTCLMAFVVPSQVSADMGVSRFKIGGGVGVTPDFGLAAHVGFAVPRLNYEDFYAFVEGTLEQYSDSALGIESTVRVIGVNALMLYPYEQWYFFGGAGLARVSGSISLGIFGEEEDISASEIKFNVTAGAGMNITELLFTEARWSHQGADLVVGIGVKIQ